MIGTVVNNYRIAKILGEGGMGVVYLAEHVVLKRQAAFKLLHANHLKNNGVTEKFINEARTLAMLDHENIVKIYDFFQEAENFCIVMEYASGIEMDEYIETISGEPFEEERAKTIFIKILEAVHYAHKKGIVHRDIKPSNIMLVNYSEPKILDFGISKLLSDKIIDSRKETTMVSTMYMSPEQARAEAVDLRTDIYSLGVTLFEMVTGKGPYDDPILSLEDIHSKVINEPLPSPLKIKQDLSEHIIHVINKATAKRPEDRFQSCSEFIAALKDVNFIYNAEIVYDKAINEKSNQKVVGNNEKASANINYKKEDFEKAKSRFLQKTATIEKPDIELKPKRKDGSYKLLYRNILYMILLILSIVIILVSIIWNMQ